MPVAFSHALSLLGAEDPSRLKLLSVNNPGEHPGKVFPEIATKKAPVQVGAFLCMSTNC